jgi:haloacetate dehalogenase
MTKERLMADLADLFPEFSSEWINTSAGRIFARVGGSGPPLLLLHGFSETHVMWHRVAPRLAASFKLIIADLPGYGWSDMPESDADHTPYTKRDGADDDRGDGAARPCAFCHGRA